MRRAFVLLGLLVACGGGGEAEKPVEQPRPAPPPSATAPIPSASASAAPSASAAVETPPPAADASDAVHAILDGFNGQDSTRYGSAYAADATLSMPGQPMLQGNGAIVTEHQQFLQSFPDTRMSGARLYAKGKIAAFEWVLSASQQGDFMGQKATNKQVGVRGVSVLEIGDDGLIKKERRYFDTANILEQIGALKAKKVRPVPLAPASMSTAQSAGSPDEDKNVEVVKKLWGAVEKKSEADFLAAMNDSIEYDDVTREQSYLGTVDMKKAFETLTTALAGAKVTVTGAWGFGSWVIAETTLTGKQVAPFEGVPRTGKNVAIHAAEVFQLRNGKIVKAWQYGNALELRTELGVYKPPPPPKKG